MSCHSCDSTADMGLRSADYFISNLKRCNLLLFSTGFRLVFDWFSTDFGLFLRRFIAGEPLEHIVDKTRGY